jgi:ABC-type Fe3+-hydroxamate transport system substrate-binding protein
MRVVSLVPSWTETLLACGVDVVGRTRFCVHPEDRVGAIPALGGTKDLKLEELKALKPDLLLLDKEENLPWMAESFGWKVHCTHIEAADDVPDALEALSDLLENRPLRRLAEEWRAELERPAYPKERVAELPGLLHWIREPTVEPEQLVYLVWRGPWMAVSRNTFVGSMLSQLGYGGRLPQFSEKYPKIDLGDFDPAKTLLLFSSEPYPFAQKKQELQGLDFPAAIVDGEAYSWFGLRSLRFLQSARAGA